MQPALIHKNIVLVKQKMIAAARKAGRNPRSVVLVAVSKKKSPTEIEAAFKSGQIHFGESYTREFTAKKHVLNSPHIKWHFVGHLQRNKVKEVVGRTYLIHSLDSFKLAQAINKQAAREKIVQNCLVQINISGEASKHGCPLSKLDELLKDLNTLDHIRVHGLMLIGSLTENKDLTQKEFAMMRQLRSTVNKQRIYKYHLSELSMGMSADFEMAIQEGATIVRIGRLIFGERDI